ncbi:IDEAL domain-containing protein [Domibacillus epiphyticus]|uniref:IDEAL domain-containing protein n=1 Tax=Domibacillus epiphyticus TaxID=1714355 RepID=A0A1V2A538_9BACI|nr:IDEAL domain-containing protein [Domibacillus epiphyticus]OMP66103.1 hypothetical protein BTO28_13945 [Domibacillus epiphyticus]
MFNYGDWVYAVSNNTLVIGYIENISFSRDLIFITKVASYVKGHPVWQKPIRATCSMDSVSHMDVTLEKEDWDSLIDLAIFTGDKEWFHQLTERKLLDA